MSSTHRAERRSESIYILPAGIAEEVINININAIRIRISVSHQDISHEIYMIAFERMILLFFK